MSMGPSGKIKLRLRSGERLTVSMPCHPRMPRRYHLAAPILTCFDRVALLLGG